MSEKIIYDSPPGGSGESKPFKGRAAGFNTPNKFDRLHVEPFDIDVAQDDPDAEGERTIPTEYFIDNSKSILSKNDSPDVPFNYSINPYRGCEHGCIYCYARPSHEYLGFSAGLDFETKIMVKLDAAKLLDAELSKKNWQPQTISLSGNTDCYQPLERKMKLTRQLLEVFLKHRNPVGIITKNALIARDIDILKELAALNLVGVAISITSMNADLLRRMEPRTASPQRRFDTIELLAKNGVFVYALVAPIIPGLNDEEIPAILNEAKNRGARAAGFTIARFPGPVLPLFLDWVQRELPDRAGKIISRIKDVRGGNLTDPRFISRMRGEGQIAETIKKLFTVNCEKLGLNKEKNIIDTSQFIRKTGSDGQMEMF